MLCIKIDEDQHKRYIKSDENIRCDNLFMEFSGIYIYIKDTTLIHLLIKTTLPRTRFFPKRMD